MKIVQTFWSKPAKSNSLMDISAGWMAPEYHWISWALSCLQAKKFYKDVELVTDERGKEILINRLQLPYTSVNTGLETALDNYPTELFSLAKIFSYNIQQEPFIHLDGDVFIFRPFDESFCASAVVAQNMEIDIPYYKTILTAISSRFKFLPGTFVLKDGPVCASNAGIFGGNNIAFIKEYCKQAFEFVDKNIGDINSLVAENKPLLNFVFEQYLLFYLAAEKKQEINYFIKEPVTDPAYRNYARLLDIPHVSLIHPVGAYKSRPFTCIQMAKRLRREFPEYYYRIMPESKEDQEDIHQYDLTASLFEGNDIANTRLSLNKNAELNEADLSQLEMLIVSMANNTITINGIMEGAREYFDEKEISQNPQSYIQLITNSIKLLLYSRILNIA